MKNLAIHRNGMSANRNVTLPAAALALAAAFLSGCGSGLSTVSTPTPIAGAALHGNVHGGQQPVSGSAIALYAAVTSGYSGTTTNLLTKTVLSDAGGGFNITGDYTCTSGQQMYVVATGGNPGSGTNPNLALMAALGDCAQLSASTNINMNEMTTVASVFALAPFMGDITAVGTDSTNTSGLAHAFASVNKLVNIASGTAPGNLLPTGATAPVSEIDTLANILAGCVNSIGGTAKDGSACGLLFAAATPANAVAPVNTIQAALNIAHNPTLNVATLYGLATTSVPFQPQLAISPIDWTMAISYSNGGFNHPATTTVDAKGNVWIANAAGNSVSVLAQSGTPLSGSPFTGNGLNGPSAIAIDIGGNAWITNSGGNSVSTFTSSGTAFGGSPFAGAGTINAPSALAIDAAGNVWIANKGNQSVTELSGTGTYAQQVNNGGAAPSGLAINPK